MKITDNIQINVTKPSFKSFETTLSKLTFASLPQILIAIIVVIIPTLFLPYVYNEPSQLRLTYFFIGIYLFFIFAIFVAKFIEKYFVNKENFKFKINFKFEFIDVCLTIYSVLILISAICSDYFPSTLVAGFVGRYEGASTLYLYIVLFYIAYKAFKFNEKILPYLACSTMIVSCDGIIQALYNLTDHTYMGAGSFGNPNFFSSYLCLFLPIYISIYLKKGNPFYLITSIITFGGLVCTKTLGGYVTFAIYFTILIIYAICKKLGAKRIVTVIFSFIIAFALLNACTNNTYFKELTSLNKEIGLAENNASSFGTGRGFIYKLALKIIQGKPFFGVGPDSLGGEVYLKYYGLPGYESDLLFDKAHSEYLHIAVCTGIPSLIFYLIFIITIAVKLLIKFFKDEDNFKIFVIGLSILSYLIQATVNISVAQVAPIFWIILGIGYNFCKDESNIKKET